MTELSPTLSPPRQVVAPMLATEDVLLTELLNELRVELQTPDEVPCVLPSQPSLTAADIGSGVTPSSYFRVKPFIDRMLTAVLMVFALPLMIAIGMAILWQDGWPIFFRQTRVGRHGRPFRIWKFRTMCNNAESSSGAVWSNATDPRVTTLGRWLRCAHLDELPQLLNVLKGEMNLIGPRPERPEFVRELAVELPFYAQRLRARPGITGLAQLRLGYDQSLAQVQDKVVLDLVYIQTAKFHRDVAILANTLPYVMNKLTGKWRSDRQASRLQTQHHRQPKTRGIGISPADLLHSTPVEGTSLQPHLKENVPMPTAGGTPPNFLLADEVNTPCPQSSSLLQYLPSRSS